MGKDALTQQLNDLLEKAKSQDLTLEELIHLLSGRGQAVLIIMLSLPFCQPIQIPGFSVPFGIVLIFIGLRIAFGHRPWLPKQILEKKISFNMLEKTINISLKITQKLKFFLAKRQCWLVRTPLLHCIHGIVIAFFALILAIPLPIPFTNIFSAIPILLFGLAFLEDDGLMIIFAYLFSIIAIAGFALLAWFGQQGFAYFTAS